MKHVAAGIRTCWFVSYAIARFRSA